VELIQGQLHDPRLPAGKVDLILLVDVYHEFSHPQLMLEAMRRALAPHGAVVLRRVSRGGSQGADQAAAQDEQAAGPEKNSRPTVSN